MISLNKFLVLPLATYNKIIIANFIIKWPRLTPLGIQKLKS